MQIDGNSIIGDIVKVNYKTAQVFDDNRIDFCCAGGISLKEACEKSNVEMTTLIPKLEVLLQLNDPDSKYIDSLSLGELCDYIERRHHTYVKDNLPFLQQKLQKLCDVHGEYHQELFEIRELFDGAAKNLSAHLNKEETILFPFIRNLTQKGTDKMDSVTDQVELKRILADLQEDHQTEGERFLKIHHLSNAYRCPPDGCATFQVTYQTLKEFEQDLHRHIHLESNILFKKAIS